MGRRRSDERIDSTLREVRIMRRLARSFRILSRPSRGFLLWLLVRNNRDCWDWLPDELRPQ
jgi:hypothetical protein